METKIQYNDAPISLSDMSALFNEGVTLPNIEIAEVPLAKPNKPFEGIIANSLDMVISRQNFEGEPFLKGEYKYRLVQLPNKRLTTFPHFYKTLFAVLNGFHLCTGSDKNTLIALANEFYFHFAPFGHITVRQHTPQRKASFESIERIVDQVIANPKPFNGRTRIKEIIWNPDYKFTGDEKRQIERVYRAKANKENQMEQLAPLFEEGLTKKEIMERTGRSESHIKRYKRKWKENRSADPHINGKRAA